MYTISTHVWIFSFAWKTQKYSPVKKHVVHLIKQIPCRESKEVGFSKSVNLR